MTTATAKLTGEVVRAGDPGYAAAKDRLELAVLPHPEAVMLCNEAQSSTIDASLSVGPRSPR